MPRITACISCLDQPELLKQTLQSIKNQSFEDWECIVVDDGSKESLGPAFDEIAKDDPRFKFHRWEVNRGIPFGANYCYREAKGEFIQTLGVDEFIWKDKFSVQIKFLDAHPEIDCVWGVPGNGPMGPVPLWEQYALKSHNRSREHWLKTFLLLEGVPIGGASALWRKSVFDSIGYFDEKLTGFSDHEWFCRFFEKHTGFIMPYRFMNEVPGHKSICTRTPKNAAKLDWELSYVRENHHLQARPTDGLITIVMPVYNNAKYIGPMLDDLFAQTDQNFELFIVNDGSDDNLPKAVRKYSDPRITFIDHSDNKGMLARANEILSIAKGEFFIILSADDKIDPMLLEKLRAQFTADPFLEHVSTQNDFLNEDGTPFTGEHPFLHIERARNHTVEQWKEIFYRGNVYFGVGMYRTNALLEVGGWEPENGVIGDYQMYLKLLPRYNFWIIEEPLTHTRIHGKNQSLLEKSEGGYALMRRYYNAQQPFYQPRPKIVIATPFYELKGFSPYIRSLVDTIGLLDFLKIQWSFLELSGDSYVHRARNMMCMNFLDDPYNTDLFFIDSDMSWNPDAFVAMIYRPEPVIGGTYPVKNKWELWTSKPIVFGGEKDKHFMGVSLPDGSSLIEASQLAGGFLRIKRSVLEKYMETYPLTYKDSHPDPAARRNQTEFFTAGVDRTAEVKLLKEIEDRMTLADKVDLSDLKGKFDALKSVRDFIGEDYSFSNRLTDMGLKLFIYPNATITHYGVNHWTGNFHEHLKKLQSDSEKH